MDERRPARELRLPGAEPEPQTKATEFNRAGDNESGRNLMSDAG